jgi:integrase
MGSVLPSSRRFKDMPRILTRDRINFCAEGLVVTFLHTKTIQFGRRRLHIPLLRLKSLLCPVLAYHHSLQVVGARRFTPAFVFIDKAQVVWLTKNKFIRTFRAIASKFVDGDVSSFTGHSFRRGGASWAFQSGVPGELIQVMGDWTSDAYKNYLEFSLDNKMQLAALFSSRLPKF